MRKLFCSLLLPLLMLFSQQGAVLHEIGHWKGAGSTEKQMVSADTPCDICLAYADMAGTAKPDSPSAGLLVDLVFHHHAESPVFGRDSESPARRSRGPPTVL